MAGSSEYNLKAIRRITREPSLAPQLLDLEVLSALRGLLRRGVITEAVARSARMQLDMLPVVRCDHKPLLSRCWELRDNLTVYDAAYLELAVRLDAPVASLDRALSAAARSEGVGIV